jgi:hypothetical protein
MSAPLPDALRSRFQILVEEGLSGRAAALRLIEGWVGKHDVSFQWK